MTDYYVGEIRMMANINGLAPIDWVNCDGRLLSIQDYQPLYSLIGTTYGGNGVTNFAVPDLRGRLPIGQGQGTGLTARTLGQSLGNETASLAEANLPPHSHSVMTAGANATTPTAGPSVTFANTSSPVIQYLKDGLGTAGGATISPAPATIGSTGLGAPHANVMPCATVNFIIAVRGLYPMRA